MQRTFVAMLLTSLYSVGGGPSAPVPMGRSTPSTEGTDRTVQDSVDPTARTLLRLEDGWARALVRRDVATFRRLLAKGFVYTENDKMVERDAVLHDVSAGSDTVEAAHNEDMRVHRFGSTAVVTGWLVTRGRGSDGPFDRRYRFTDTWARRNGRWQIVAAQDYLAPQAAQ